MSGRTPKRAVAPPAPIGGPCLDLVEHERDAVGRGQLAHALEVARPRTDDRDVHHRRLEDQRGDAVADVVEHALEQVGIVERDRLGQRGHRVRVAAAVRDAARLAALAERVERRAHRDHDRVVVAVVGALDLEDHDRVRWPRARGGRRPWSTRCRSS